MRDHVADFSAGVPQDDDRTAVVLKRRREAELVAS
jgi:hypothetical protein